MDYSPYYKILGISPGADEEQLRLAYRKLALKLHPDVNPHPEAHQQFINLGEAYEVLMRRLQQEGPEGAVYSWPTAEDKSDFSAWEDIIRQARDRARRQAEMRFEKMQREHEAFRQSGLYDLSLAFRYLLHVFTLLLIVGLLALPIWVAIAYDPWALFYLSFSWIVGGFLTLYVYSQRAIWFRLGKFHFTPETILELFQSRVPENQQNCFYCKGYPANGLAYEQTLIKINDVKLVMGGPMVHQAGYKRSYKTIQVPRSTKAFAVHFAGSLLKILSITGCLLFYPGSLIWAFLLGILTGGIGSGLLMLISATRPKTLHFINPLILLKAGIWVFCIYMVSDFREGPYLFAGEYIYLTFTLLILFIDVLVDPMVRGVLGQSAITSFFKLPKGEKDLLSKGYIYYLEIPIWSTLYPLIRWLF